MREVHGHEITPVGMRLKIETLDAPGPGGAHHDYLVSHSVDETQDRVAAQIQFQNGPIKEAGINGITEASLLAIVADRLRSFQAGPFSCRENAIALTKIEEALHWLHHRTRERLARGVEGTNQK